MQQLIYDIKKSPTIMIGKVMVGKGFAGCISYCLDDKKMKKGMNPDERLVKNRAEILQHNLCFGDKKNLCSQFNDVRKLNPKQSRPVMHITLSLAPGEILDRPQLLEIVQECANEFGFEHNQFFSVEHLDTNHQHLHIVANRINLEGKTNVNDSNSFKKMARFCRKMEIKYGLAQVASPRAFLPREQKQIPRNDSRKNKIKAVLQHAIRDCKSLEAFYKSAEAKGFQVVKSSGIAFIDAKGVKVKGSDIGLSLQVIEKQVARNSLALETGTKFIKLPQRKQSRHW
ncbi:MAG: relaxase/mobilization nuclease domain-containing protein [Bacteroidota bacterium]|nr:relaxase/mobilization nuclease domain-containing protein [Bacteroidota bacterium]